MAIFRNAGLVMAALMVVAFVGSADALQKCNKGWKGCNSLRPGCETGIDNDLNNCGDCGKKCGSLPYTAVKCVYGECVYSCTNGWANCDNDWKNGCETDIGNDAKNCGKCGYCCKQFPYAITKCSNGQCQPPQCQPGWSNCDNNWNNGCETDTGNDVKNCGACGNCCKQVPYATTTCYNGKCTYTCNPGWANCDADWSNGCETDIGNDVKNCGSCGNCCKVTIKGAYPTCSNGKCGQQCHQGWWFDQKNNCCVPSKTH